MTRKLYTVLMFALLFLIPEVSFARGSAPESVKRSAPDVDSSLMEWKEAVEGSDAEAIVALYDKKAVMISTFVQLPITSHKELLSYYKKVVSNPDVRVEIEEEHPRKFGNMAINTGRYTLSYTQEGEEVVIPARFSFVYQLQDRKWMIVDHHSSAMPMQKPVK